MSKLLAETLQRALADTYFVYLKNQNYHWNVTGSSFQSLHNLFQNHYEELAIAIDTIAERVRTLGYYCPGSFSEFTRLTSVKETQSEGMTDKDMIQDLIDTYKIVIASFDKVIEVAKKNNDEVSIDLGIVRISKMEKHIWMLKSSL